MLTCLGSAAFAAAAVYITLHRAGASLLQPLNYLEDANIFLTRAKSIIEGNWVWRNPRLGMPFGANWIDFPMNVTLESAGMWVLSRFTSSAPLVVNLDWLIGIAASAGLAAYAFARLGVRLAGAGCCGVLFALLPYTWFQGTKHLHCLSCAVPLVAASAIELLRGRLAIRVEGESWWNVFRRVPVYAWVGCILAGFSYAYIAFFAAFLLLCASLIAGWSRRDLLPFWLGGMLAAGMIAMALVDLAPTLVYQARNGANASMLFKNPAEVEIYGFKIRYLLTPVPGHPIGWLRRAEGRLADVKFPAFVNENEYTRLGTIGSFGFLCLLGYAIGAALDSRFAHGEAADLLGPCAALTLVSILFASVGGLSVFFAAFVTPEIRAWSRIFPFIGFFSIAAAAAVAAPLSPRLPAPVRYGTLAAIAILGVFDQAVPSAAYDHRDSLYRTGDDFVHRVENALPADSGVFELPFSDFPNDSHPGKLLVNDLLRPYLHSGKYRWSWGAVSGTTSAEWSRAVAAMAPAEMLNGLVHTGFAGLWVDLAGYAQVASPEESITKELGVEPLRSPEGRFLFYDLRRYAASVWAAEAEMPESDRLARNPVLAVFERGFYSQETAAGRIGRWSLGRGRITLVNPLDVSRRVGVSMRLEAADARNHVVRVAWPGGSEVLRTPALFQRDVVAPPGRFAFDISCECPGLYARGRTMYFLASDFALLSR